MHVQMDIGLPAVNFRLTSPRSWVAEAFCVGCVCVCGGGGGGGEGVLSCSVYRERLASNITITRKEKYNEKKKKEGGGGGGGGGGGEKKQ